MNIPVPHVVVAFDRRTISTLFKVGTNYEDLAQEIAKSDDALLFDSQANPNFISFEHTFGGNEEGNIMKLTLIDPKKEFEERFMLENSSNSLHDYIAKKRPQKSDPIRELWAQQAKSDAEVTSEISKYKGYFAGELAKQQNKTQRLYVAYGVGPNLDSWSGPHTMQLLGAEIAIEGSRQITLTMMATKLSFSTEGRRDIHQTDVNLNLHGMGIEIDARSFPINFANFAETIYPPYKEKLPESLDSLYLETFETEYAEYLDLVNLEDSALFINKLDIHLLLTDVIRDLIRKATGNSNVIVLLPNLNYTLAHMIQQNLKEEGLDEATRAKRQAQRDYDNIVKDMSAMGLNADGSLINPGEASGWPGWDGFNALQEQKAAQRNLTIWNTVVENNETYYHRFTEIGKLFYVLSKIVADFGMTVNSSRKNNQIEGILKVLESYKDQDKATSYNNGLHGFLNSRYFTVGITHTSTDGFPDYWGILQNITRNLSRATLGISAPNLQLFYESDLKLLEFWSDPKWKDFPLFGGTDRVFTSDEGAIIFGDQQLIRDFLYGAEQFGVSEAKKKATISAYEDEFHDLNSLDPKQTAYNEANDLGPGMDEQYENAEIEQARSILNLMPLHPLDKVIFAEGRYNKEVREITYPPHAIIGAYGNISFIPDDFQHVDNFSKENKEEIENLGIPVFRYNTENPNVLDLKLDNSLIYRNNLNVGFRRDVARRATATAGGILESQYASLPLTTIGDVIGFIRMHEKSLGNNPTSQKLVIEKLAKKFKAFDLGLFQGTNFTEQAKAAYAEYAATLENPDSPILKIDQLLPGDPVVAMAEFSDKMYRQSLQMSITTLPSFHFGTGKMLMSPCMLFAQDAPILQTQSEMPPATLLNTFMSGWYTIIGFTHTISTQGASSEFSLVKINKSLTPATIQKTKKEEKPEAKKPEEGTARKVPTF